MKEVYDYTSSQFEFLVFEHNKIFYLRKKNSDHNILRCDDVRIAKSWIDGFQKCVELLPMDAYKIIKENNSFR